MQRLRYSVWIFVLFPLIWAPRAQAVDGWGPRFGFTANPDQMHLGMHLDAGEMSPRFRFQPNFELGVGDNLTLAAFNLEAVYVFGDAGINWRPYVGGGVGINVIDRNRVNHRDDTHVDGGMSVIGGMEHMVSMGNMIFTEVKFGMIDAPDLKWTFGLTFYR